MLGTTLNSEVKGFSKVHSSLFRSLWFNKPEILQFFNKNNNFFISKIRDRKKFVQKKGGHMNIAFSVFYVAIIEYLRLNDS